jgi:FkbM family methyltransferase
MPDQPERAVSQQSATRTALALVALGTLMYLLYARASLKQTVALRAAREPLACSKALGGGGGGGGCSGGGGAALAAAGPLGTSVRPSCAPLSDTAWRASNLTYSQHDLDLRMKRYLTRTHGFYIESGAFDGMTASNTYIYQQQRCWTGLLVEPSPENARAAAANRPHDVVEHSALVGPAYVEATIRGAFHSMLVSKVDAGGDVEVPAHTMTALLEKHRVPHVHWWSLDVEGFELEVLRGLDFARWTPDYILVELWDDNAAVKSFLAARGYTIEADISPWHHATPHRDVLFRSAAATEHQALDSTFTYDHLPWYDRAA